MGYRHVEAQYSNACDATVKITIRDATGRTQMIASNAIHSFFVQLPEGPAVPLQSAGHRYSGNIARRAWIDAAELKPGYRLLNDDGSWATVTGTTVERKPLTAYNLTVNGFHTYFVSGTADASPVWVHNDCAVVTYDEAQLQAKYKHAKDFGINGNFNKQNLSSFQAAIDQHLRDPATYSHGTYLREAGSTVLFNPNTNNVVVVTKEGKFSTGFKLDPGTPQYEKFMKDGILR